MNNDPIPENERFYLFCPECKEMTYIHINHAKMITTKNNVENHKIRCKICETESLWNKFEVV